MPLPAGARLGGQAPVRPSYSIDLSWREKSYPLLPIPTASVVATSSWKTASAGLKSSAAETPSAGSRTAQSCATGYRLNGIVTPKETPSLIDPSQNHRKHIGRGRDKPVKMGGLRFRRGE